MNIRSLRVRVVLPLCTIVALAGAVSAAAGACSASKEENTFGTGGAGTSSAHGGAGAAGGGSSTESAHGGEGGNILVDDGGGPDQFNPDSACAATTAAAEPIPLDLVILLDKSGSMDDGIKWPGATNALKAFINDPASNGISIGLEYFPVDLPPDGNECNYLHYKDLDVPLGMLPANSPALINSINANFPTGGTPMYPAVKGALYAATERQDAFPDHKVVVVLATDGEPTSCPPTDVGSIAALAASALNYNGVQTYTIAMQGSNVAALNQIAAGGGTMQSFDITANIQAFSQKMAEIRQASLGCEFTIPEPPAPQKLDPEKVNVNYTPGGQGMPQTLPHAENLADCGNGKGWYYDNNAMPTKIFLCPASCDIVKADLNADVKVAFGCKTEIN